eukprot:11018580-Alexandrium_andersonii.AAC.1
MSASLVGSEMCIRDSPEAARGVLMRAELAALALRQPLLGDLVLDGGAVSYTHLTLPTICSV